MSTNHEDTTTEAAPCVMVIFGVTGDLTKRKLIPALINLAQENLLSKQFAIVGFAMNDYTTESFRKVLGEEIPKFAPEAIDLKMWEWLSERIYYIKGKFQDAEAFQRGLIEQGNGRQVEQPGGHDAAAAPHFGDVRQIEIVLVMFRMAQRRGFRIRFAVGFSGVGML